jgi:hypothetical protein
MAKKRSTTTLRRRELLRRLDDALVESVDTRRRLANHLERDETGNLECAERTREPARRKSQPESE